MRLPIILLVTILIGCVENLSVEIPIDEDTQSVILLRVCDGALSGEAFSASEKGRSLLASCREMDAWAFQYHSTLEELYLSAGDLKPPRFVEACVDEACPTFRCKSVPDPDVIYESRQGAAFRSATTLDERVVAFRFTQPVHSCPCGAFETSEIPLPTRHRAHALALADGALLVTNDSTSYLIDSDGSLSLVHSALGAFTVSEAFVSQEGSIWLGGAEGRFKRGRLESTSSSTVPYALRITMDLTTTSTSHVGAIGGTVTRSSIDLYLVHQDGVVDRYDGDQVVRIVGDELLSDTRQTPGVLVISSERVIFAQDNHRELLYWDNQREQLVREPWDQRRGDVRALRNVPLFGPVAVTVVGNFFRYDLDCASGAFDGRCWRALPTREIDELLEPIDLGLFGDGLISCGTSGLLLQYDREAGACPPMTLFGAELIRLWHITSFGNDQNRILLTGSVDPAAPADYVNRAFLMSR